MDTVNCKKNVTCKMFFNLRNLRLSLKYRPKIFRYIIKIREKLHKKNKQLKILQKELLKAKEISSHTQHASCQTETFTCNEVINHCGEKAESEERNGIPKHVSNILNISQENPIQRQDVSCQTDTITDILNKSEEECKKPIEKTSRIQKQDASCQTKVSNSDAVTTFNKVNEECQQPTVISNVPKFDSTLNSQEIHLKHYDSTQNNICNVQITKSEKKKDKEDSIEQLSSETTIQSQSISNLNDGSACKAEAIDSALITPNDESSIEPKTDMARPWDGVNEMSIADQVKEAAQSAMAQSGMVYVESAGMYYDYKTGYYYNSELGLYYHTDTGCYYYYSNEKQEFVFHSYPDPNVSAAYEALSNHERKKAKKHKQDKEKEDAIKNKKKKTKKIKKEKDKTNNKDININSESSSEVKDVPEDMSIAEVEDGECSLTENETTDEESCGSISTVSDDESVACNHPPCMRLIVQETSLFQLRVGSLFLITKDGGSIGREGEHHTILLKEPNVSREHLHITYNKKRKVYVAMDLGSRNGTLLNGARMSKSQVVSSYMEVPHGSTIQLGETKLLCHIHPGNATCGHCEPGLLMPANVKEKKAYPRTYTVQKQHQLELARLKNKYAPEPLAIEDGSYKDRAKERRDEVGSSHSAEKTQQSDLDTIITSENKGFRLLQKMGWSEGEGLGKDKQGKTEPIPLVTNEHKAGLGAIGSAAPVVVGQTGMVLQLTKKKKNKLLRPPAKAFRDPLEDDDTE